MKNEQKKSDNHSIYIIIIALVLCAVAYCSVRGCGSGAGTAEVHQRTDGIYYSKPGMRYQKLRKRY